MMSVPRLAPQRRFALAATALAAASFLVACSGDSPGGTVVEPPPPPPTPVLTTLAVTLSTATISVGGTATAAAAGRDQFGKAIAAGTITWSSSADSVATVTNTGSITGISVGQTTITAVSSSVTASAVLNVTPGGMAACRLPAQYGGATLGFPRVAARHRTVGDVHVPVVFIDFPDAVATRTPEQVYGILSPMAAAFYSAVSYGRMNLVLEPTFVWNRMSKASSQYGWSAPSFNVQKAYIEEALSLATTTDFSQADAFAIISNPDAGAIMQGRAFVANAGTGATVQGRTIDNGVISGRDLTDWGGLWLSHEMGHTMGLPDLYASSGAALRYVGNFGLMGLITGFAPEFFAWERWQLGWIDDDQVSCATSSGTIEVLLSPIERVGGMKMVVIPTGPSSAVVVESRRAEGYDTSDVWTPGVLIYSVDTSLSTGNGPLKVLPINDLDSWKSSAPLLVGGTMSVGGVTITFVSTTAEGDVVRVVR
ncbi:MAG TPA: M6 family metalloprotease domain-containing protein [Longimicrobiales bacterium]